MTAVVHFHPVITQELLLKTGIQFTDYTFEYDGYAGTSGLVTEPILGQEHLRSQLFLKDEREEWGCASHNLRLTKDFVIQNAFQLFGSNGVAGKGAEIGVAVIWASKPSNQRGIFIGESFNSSSDQKIYKVSGEFPKGTLRDRFHLQTILYIKRPGELAADEQHLAKNPGTILGYLDETIIHLEGNGSLFPIFSFKEEGPLWRVECNWLDPRVDPFDDDNVRIILNESHPDFKYTVSSDKGQLTPLMKEIIASSIQIIIEKVKEDVPLSDINGTETDRGSICMAIQYFINTFLLDTSSSQNLAVSIRKHLDRKMGGIA